MAPVDPGATILWAKNPAYSTALVSRISTLSKSEAESLFSSNKSRSAEWKLAKQASLERVTKEVFTAGGDHAREKKQLDSTCRRVAQLFKQYEDSLGLLRQDPYNVAETLGESSLCFSQPSTPADSTLTARESVSDFPPLPCSRLSPTNVPLLARLEGPPPRPSRSFDLGRGRRPSERRRSGK